jgi:hypothetical protein
VEIPEVLTPTKEDAEPEPWLSSVRLEPTTPEYPKEKLYPPRDSEMFWLPVFSSEMLPGP